MDSKNTKQFTPGYHSITGHETVRIKSSHDRYCQAQDAATDSGQKVFILGETKRQFDRWKADGDPDHQQHQDQGPRL